MNIDDIPELNHTDSFHTMQLAAWENSEAHGFHGPNEDGHVSTPAERLMLIVDECCEALRALREPGPMDTAHFGEELADIVIRTMDLAHSAGIDLGCEVVAKHNMNRRRPLRHGGKKL
jgi:NTP pyrophosphatase (non-canonical NTP hydrolase)